MEPVGSLLTTGFLLDRKRVLPYYFATDISCIITAEIFHCYHPLDKLLMKHVSVSDTFGLVSSMHISLTLFLSIFCNGHGS